MNKRIFLFILFVSFFILLISSIQAIPNPASQYCEQNGGTLEKITNEDGSQYGICNIQGGNIEEWEFYKENLGGKEIYNIAEEKSIAKKDITHKKGFFEKIIEEKVSQKIITKEIVSREITAAISWDWRNYNGQNWVSSVQDQLSCGSCTIFSIIGIVESKTKINLNNGGYNIDLSEQDAVSCAGGGSCLDGWSETDILNYIKNTGIVKESCFNYTATDNTCNNKCSNWQNETLKISNYEGIFASDSAIKNAINNYGPITVYLVACSDFSSFSGTGIYAHSGDVYYDDSCWYDGGDGYDYLSLHSVSIIGYNDASEYWIIKNNWGNVWGDSGYAKVAYSQSVYDSSSWYNAVLYGEGDNRVFFLDNSFYISGTDITTPPTISSALANNTYAQSSTPINFSVYALPKSIKLLSSVKINGTSMTGSLQYGGTFSVVKTPAQLNCTQNSETTCSIPINATDDSGISSTTSVSISVDDLAPRVTEITLDDLDGYVNSAQIFTISVNVADANTSKVRINNSDLSLVSSLYKLTTNSTNVGCTSTICNLTVVANDTVGNINNTEKRQITIDNSIPSVILNSPSNNSWTPTTSPKINYTLTDSISPNSSCALTINSITYTSTVNNNTQKEVLVTGLPTNTEYPWYVTCTDLAGNINVSNQWIIKSDATAPASSITLNNTANSNGWIRLPTLVNITATDTSGSGVNYTQWKNSSTGNWMNISDTFVLSENLSENIIYYKSVDNILNTEIEKQKSFKYDSTNPIINSVVSSSNLIAAGASFTVDIFATDTLSGLEGTSTTLLNGTASNLIYSSGKYSGTLTAPQTDGIYNLTVNVTDKAGNNISNNLLQINVNSTLPTISVDKTNGTIVSNNSVLTITFNGIDNAWYNYTGGTEISTNLSTATLIINGSGTFNLWIWANNSISTTNQNYTYIIDTTIPAISFSTPSTNLIKVNGSLNVIASSSDASGITNVVLAIDGTTFATDTTSPYSFNLATTAYSDGLHTLKLTSTDNSGLSNSTELTINITNNLMSMLFNVLGDVSNSAGTISSNALSGTPYETVIDGITGLNSTNTTITLLTTAPNNPSSSQLSTVIGKINISTDTAVNSIVYMTIPKDTLVDLGLTSPYTSIAFYADHGSGVVGPLTSDYIDTITKEGVEYERFYLETTDYSIFFWGIQGTTIILDDGDGGSSGGGGGGGGGSSGGGGGGGGEILIKINDSAFEEGYNIKVFNNWGLQAIINNESHIIKVVNITNSTLTINVSSTNPQQEILEIGDTKNFDIDDDKIYDLSVTLHSIFKGISANITIKKTMEQMPGLTSQEPEVKEEESSLIIIILAIILISAGIVAYLKFFKSKSTILKKRHKKKSKKKDSKNS